MILYQLDWEMIDTVVVKYCISPTQKQLKEWNLRSSRIPKGKICYKYFHNTYIDESTLMKLNFYPKNTPFPSPSFQIELSLPRVLYGNNISMITNEAEIEEAIDKANRFISRIPWIPTIDIGEGILYRLDLCYNHFVGDQVEDYIDALFRLTYPHRKTRLYPDEGVQYTSKIATTKFYGKERQCHNPSAYGILRQETTLRKSHNIGKRLDTPYPTLRDVRKEWVKSMLQKDLDNLRLKDNLVCNRDIAVDILLEKHGYTKGTRLIGHLITRQTMNDDQLIAKGINKRNIRRNDKLIADAGVSLSLINSKVPLQPLIIRL